MVVGFAMVGMVQGWIDAGERPSIGWQVLAYAILTASEVMVSITGLEFAYTQAPKRMKSVIMALFLMSVSLGNLFTATVNHYIVVPDRLGEAKSIVSDWRLDKTDKHVDNALHHDRKTEAAKLGIDYQEKEEGGFTLTLKHWEESIDDGDIRVGYGPDLERQSLVASEVDVITNAVGLIGEFWNHNDRLPFADEGANAISSLKDPWGKPLHYRLVNRKSFVVTSDGPDKTFMTTNDVRAEVTVESHSVLQQQEMAAESGGSDVLSGLHPTHSWIVVRQAKIDAEKARESGNSSATWEDFIPKAEEGERQEIVKQNHNFDITWQIGGATTLAGAAYFEFFTWLMLGTAIVFVIVGYFYKPKTYIQDEGMVSATATLE